MDALEARLGHEQEFRETWELHPEVKDDPYWQHAYEYAAKYKLNHKELDEIGSVLIRKLIK